MRTAQKIFGWLFTGFAAVYGWLRFASDWIGRSTVADDASQLLTRLKPVSDFVSRQQDLWFYIVWVSLITVGLALLVYPSWNTTETSWRVRTKTFIWAVLPFTQPSHFGPMKERMREIERILKDALPRTASQIGVSLETRGLPSTAEYTKTLLLLMRGKGRVVEHGDAWTLPHLQAEKSPPQPDTPDSTGSASRELNSAPAPLRNPPSVPRHLLPNMVMRDESKPYFERMTDAIDNLLKIPPMDKTEEEICSWFKNHGFVHEPAVIRSLLSRMKMDGRIIRPGNRWSENGGGPPPEPRTGMWMIAETSLWIASASRWGAEYAWAPEEWPIRVGREISRAVTTGEIQAWGVRVCGGKEGSGPRQISPEEWESGHIDWADWGADGPATTLYFDDNPDVRYIKIRFRKAEVVANWPIKALGEVSPTDRLPGPIVYADLWIRQAAGHEGVGVDLWGRPAL